jgi:non-homologous end joining protein Ku
VGLPKKKKVPRATVLKFERLIGSKSKKQPSKSQLEDDQADRLKKLIAKKRSQRRNIVEVETDESDGRKGKVIDLVAVLKRNLAGKKKAAR